MYSAKNCPSNCIPYQTPIEPSSLSRAYVPFQIYCSIYGEKQSLLSGTVFPGLYKPYVKKNENCGNCGK